MPPNGIFVFGSNTEGRHGLGAAKDAKDNFGAIQFQAKGLQGQSYAIITKDLAKGKRSIPLYGLEGLSIAEGVRDFIEYANAHPELKFYVTKIGAKNAGYSVEEMKDVFNSVNRLFITQNIENYIPDNVILPQEYEVRSAQQPISNVGQLTPTSTSTRTVDYTPKGKEKQTYTIEGARILNKNGEEVFKEDSVDRNKIFANLAVKEGRAVVVNYRGIKYVVNNKNQIISGATGKVMQWGERNGDRQAILALANSVKNPVANTPIVDTSAITESEIATIYNSKVETAKAQNIPFESLESFLERAKRLITNLQKLNNPKESILEAIQCL
jgi:hypothetical protein